MSEVKKEEALAIPEEVKEQVAKNLKRVNQEAKAGDLDPAQPRTKSSRLATKVTATYETMPNPVQLDPDEFGPTSFAAVMHGEITGETDTQQFILDADKIENLHFTKPGLNLPQKRLYTVKAFNPSGVLVQLPFEDQIQNTAGGDSMDAIGLHRYARKGFKLLFSFETFQPVYCAAWGCWAKADGRTGFCTPRHAQHTLPNQYNMAGEIVQSLLSQGVTTSRTWQA